MSELIACFCDICNPEHSLNSFRGFAYAPMEICIDQLGWKDVEGKTWCEECIHEVLVNHKQDQD